MICKGGIMEKLSDTRLKELIDTINVRRNTYRKATLSTEEKETKLLFEENSLEGLTFESNLSPYLEEEASREEPHAFKVWNDITNKIENNKFKDTRSLTSSCLEGEELTIKLFEDILNEEDLPIDVGMLLKQLLSNLKDSHKALEEKLK